MIRAKFCLKARHAFTAKGRFSSFGDLLKSLEKSKSAKVGAAVEKPVSPSKPKPLSPFQDILNGMRDKPSVKSSSAARSPNAASRFDLNVDASLGGNKAIPSLFLNQRPRDGHRPFVKPAAMSTPSSGLKNSSGEPSVRNPRRERTIAPPPSIVVSDEIDNKKRKKRRKPADESEGTIPVENFQRIEPEDSGGIIDIAELKRRTAERISKNMAASAPETPVQTKNQPIKKASVIKVVSLPVDGLYLRDLAGLMSAKVGDVRAKLEELGELASDTNNAKKGSAQGSEDSFVEADVAELVALELGFDVQRADSEPKMPSASESGDASLAPRSPVVSIMGHVDHGKTTLLDTLRSAQVAASEAGGITQKLSAFTVQLEATRPVVFLDTPGHAAFSAMRSNGASATDVVVLVVALDEGVRTQTIEALKTAKEAKCSILVALNKIDRVPLSERSGARAKVLNQLVEYDVVAEDYGGDVLVVEVSGRTGEGVKVLIENIALHTDLLDLKAPVAGPAEAIVLDANMEKGRGVVADVLVRWGSLRVGDAVVVGTTFGKVKAMVDSSGNSISEAGPSTPVRLTGLREVPIAGQEMISVPSEAKARLITVRRTRVVELRSQRQKAVVDDSKGEGTGAGSSEAHVNVILKADGVGTLKALEKVVEGIKTRSKEVQVTVVSSSIGDVTQSDVERASVSGASATTVVLGFNVLVADSGTRSLAKELEVKICRDTVIYRLEDELVSIMGGLMPKERVLTPQGSAKVLQVFAMRDKAATVVAGLSVESGSLKLSSGKGQFVYRLNRGNRCVLEEKEQAQLKKFKESVNEVEQGLECGLVLENVKDYEVGDVVECLKVEWKPRKLVLDESSSP